MLVFLTAASAVGDGFSGAFGIGFASTAAIQAGIASLPTPVTEFDSDNWIFHRFYHLIAPHVIDGGVSNDTGYGPAWLRVEIDSKAMRKVPDDDVGLYMAWEHTLSGTATIRFLGRTRMLSKLS